MSKAERQRIREQCAEAARVTRERASEATRGDEARKVVRVQNVLRYHEEIESKARNWALCAMETRAQAEGLGAMDYGNPKVQQSRTHDGIERRLIRLQEVERKAHDYAECAREWRECLGQAIRQLTPRERELIDNWSRGGGFEGVAEPDEVGSGLAFVHWCMEESAAFVRLYDLLPQELRER